MMGVVARCCLATLLLSVGCGGESGGVGTFSIEVPWQSPLIACSTPANLATMEVHVYIGGYEDTPCQLEVHPTTLAASGVCQGVLAGISRPVAIAYTLPSAGSSAGLGLYVGRVDLSDSEGTPSGEVIQVGLDGWTSVWDQAGLEQLTAPPLGCARVEADDSQGWARCLVAGELGLTLDCGDTGEANLTRACEARLSGCP